MLVLGAAGAMLERGAPPFGAPGDEVRAFFARYHGELLTQSVVFVLAAGANLWFLAGLRCYLQRAEGRNGVLAALAFAAGVTGVAIGALIHAPQVALATRAGAGVAPEVAGIVADLGYGLSLIAFVPIAVMLASVAAVSWRTGAFPAWVGWVSVRGAVAHVVGWFGVIVDADRSHPEGGSRTSLRAVDGLARRGDHHHGRPTRQADAHARGPVRPRGSPAPTRGRTVRWGRTPEGQR